MTLVALVIRTAAGLLALAMARPVAAQVIRPPNIQKPIESARKAAGATSAGIQNAQKVADDPKAQLPAAAAQAGAKGVPSTAKEAKSMKAAADRKASLESAMRDSLAADSASRRGSASRSASKAATTVYREEFSYDDEGRRDPFLSLMSTGEIRPLLVDLALIGVLFDKGQPARSIAILVDGTSGETYRRRAGETIGRMKVTNVSEREIALSLDEFGFSRQETLPLDMNPRKAGAAPGRRP